MTGVVERLHRAMREICRPQHLRRTGTIALAVGAWLTLVNQGPQLLQGSLTVLCCVQIGLNLLTPFVVANLGLLAHGDRADARHQDTDRPDGLSDWH